MTSTMKFIDIHTHNKSEETTYAIFNSNGEPTTGCASVGIHPWDVDDNWEERFRTIRELAKAPDITAIGECGIDRAHSGAGLDSLAFGVVHKLVKTRKAQFACRRRLPAA